MPKTDKHKIERIAEEIRYKAQQISVKHRTEISNLICDCIIANATNVKTVSKFKKVKQKITEL